MQIEKNVPMPKQRPFTRYPFGEMDVGDSIFVEGAKTPCPASVAASQWGKHHNCKFAARSVDGGVRIWRIA